MTELNVGEFKGKRGYEKFTQFQHKLMAKIYFQSKSDLKWNFYLIFVIDDKEFLQDIPIADIENDENFARKYFFSGNEAIEFLNRGKYVKPVIDGSAPANPVSEWTAILETVKLTGVLYNDYASTPVNDYIYNNVPFNAKQATANLRRNLNSTTNETKFDHICEVDIAKFRPHCFGPNEKFRPVLVNLLHGSNGSGKSSILESIEHAITNSVRKLEDFKDTVKLPTIAISGVSKDGPITLRSNKAVQKCKELDNAWYGTPMGRGTCALNTNFNRFNCFNAESAYKFALEESRDERKHYDMFTNLFFDNSILEMQKRWVRYEKEFIEHKKRLEIDRTKIAKKLSDLEYNVQAFMNPSTNNSAFELKELLTRISFSDNTEINEKEDSNYEKTQAHLKNLAPIAGRLKSNLERAQIFTFQKVLDRKKILEAEVSKLRNDLQLNQDKISKEKKKTEEKHIDIKRLKQEDIQQENHIRDLKEALNMWQKVEFVITNRARVEEYQNLVEKYKRLQSTEKLIQKINIEYPTIQTMKPNDVEGCSEEEMLEIRKSLQSRKDRLAEVNHLINEAKKNVDKYRQMKLQLKTIATSLILSEKNNDHKCPLCGNIHESQEILINKINGILLESEDDQLFLTLESQKDSLLKDINDFDLLLKEYNVKQNNIRKLFEAAKLVNSEIRNISLDKKPCEILEEVQKNLILAIEQIRELENIQRSINVYSLEGYNDNAILDAKAFISSNPYYLRYDETGNKESSFRAYLSVIIQEEEQRKVKIKEAIDLANSDIEGSIKIISLLNSDGIQNRINELLRETDIFLEMVNDHQRCKVYFNIAHDKNLLTWATDLDNALIKLEIHLNYIHTSKLIQRQKEEINKDKEEQRNLDLCLQRCNKAVDAFKGMPRLDERVKDFIEINKASIEYFFKALHMPREFVSLSLERDEAGDRLIAIRGVDNKPIRIYQMSTGQRTALVLAVLFTLHLSAVNAPEFLILDEPVANMDDLHLMNLIDILRELALQGIQIIFTTANPTVAGLFRRKFSFFGEAFNHFELIRSNNEITRITTYSYTPDKETGEILKPVS
ncbi:hypothetical protein SRRS_35860 [Sporomusa rhizae]|uniref:AAA family ATPase n=1 Tax=Sporomusa rhizae TaxID=357999 RepID=UPI00352AA740